MYDGHLPSSLPEPSLLCDFSQFTAHQQQSCSIPAALCPMFTSPKRGRRYICTMRLAELGTPEPPPPHAHTTPSPTCSLRRQQQHDQDADSFKICEGKATCKNGGHFDANCNCQCYGERVWAVAAAVVAMLVGLVVAGCWSWLDVDWAFWGRCAMGVLALICIVAATWTGSACETCGLTCKNGGTLDAQTCTCNCAPGYVVQQDLSRYGPIMVFGLWPP